MISNISSKSHNCGILYVNHIGSVCSNDLKSINGCQNSLSIRKKQVMTHPYEKFIYVTSRGRGQGQPFSKMVNTHYSQIYSMLPVKFFNETDLKT